MELTLTACLRKELWFNPVNLKKETLQMLLLPLRVNQYFVTLIWVETLGANR